MISYSGVKYFPESSIDGSAIYSHTYKIKVNFYQNMGPQF